jgi:hypothetical protein
MSNINITIQYPENSNTNDLIDRLAFLRSLTNAHPELSRDQEFVKRLTAAENTVESLLS